MHTMNIGRRVSVFWCGIFLGCIVSTLGYLADDSWTLSMVENFDGPSLNTSLWNIKANQSHCCQLGKEELQLYVPDEVFVKKGRLNIRTRFSEAGVLGPGGKRFNFTSGWIDSKMKFSQQYGKFEANCSLPPRSARGAWPAFWLMPEEDLCWPTGGEIDIFEFNADPLQDNIFGSYHWAPPKACGKDRAPIPGKSFKPAGSGDNWQEQWHVYSLEWSDTEIKYFVDGTQYFSRTSSQVDLPTNEMYIIFDQAVDPILFPPTLSHPGKGYRDGGVLFQVEWVKVWFKKGDLTGQ